MSATTAPERSLAEQIRARASGILTISDGKVRRLFCLRKGALIHAASNIIEEQFEEFLVRENHVNAADRARAKLAASTEGISTLQWILDQGLLAASESDALIVTHATSLLREALGSAAAVTQFMKGTPNLEGKPTTEVPLDLFLIEFLRDHPKSPQEVRVRLGQPGMLPVRITAREEQAHALASRFPTVGEVWKLADGDLTVVQLIKHVPSGEDQGLRAVYGLLLLGAIEALAAGDKVSASPTQVPVTRHELLTRLDSAIDANHYSVLELASGADFEEVRRSYYRLAQRYHPDRFRTGDHEALLPRIETFFAQVTEAYNTLSDAANRRSYDQELANNDERTRTDPTHDTSYLARQNFLRARAVVKRNQYQQAVTFLENAIELEENVPEYHVELGTVLIRNPRRRDDAEEHLRRGIELDPTVAAGHLALADLMLKRDREDAARAAVVEALKWVPGNVELNKLAKELGDGKGRGLFRR